MPALILKNVSYRYKKADKFVLRNVSCQFNEGQMAAIVGPSGSGKTTLLSILAGLDRPTEGLVYLGEQDLSQIDLDDYRRHSVSVVFQAFQLFPLLTVLENVCFPMELNGMQKSEAKKKAREHLTAVGIDSEKHKRYPANLSGGEQQRVAIARAVASGARIILADEPTGNLDGENSKNIVALLQSLAHNSNYCVVIVTHDMAIAEVSDIVYRVSDGFLTRLDTE